MKVELEELISILVKDIRIWKPLPSDSPMYKHFWKSLIKEFPCLLGISVSLADSYVVGSDFPLACLFHNFFFFAISLRVFPSASCSRLRHFAPISG